MNKLLLWPIVFILVLSCLFGNIVVFSATSTSTCTVATRSTPIGTGTLSLLGAPLGVTGWSDSVKKSIVEGINPFIPITKAQFDREISLLFVNPPPISDAVKMGKVNDYVTRNRHYQQVWDIVNLYNDAMCQAPRIQLPTLVIWGQADQIYDIRGVDRLQRCIPGSQIRQLPKAGHLPIVENAHQVASYYLSFLKVTTTPFPPKK